MPNVSNRSRQPAGVPTGGEFAAEMKGENPDLEVGVVGDSAQERAERAERALLRMYEMIAPGGVSGLYPEAAAFDDGRESLKESLRDEMEEDPEIMAAIDRQRQQRADTTDVEALALLAEWTGADSTRRRRIFARLKELQGSGYDITRGGTRTVLYPARLLRTGDVIVEAESELSPRSRIDGMVREEDGVEYGGERTVLSSNSGIVAIRDRRNGNQGAYFWLAPGETDDSSRVLLGRRNEPNLPPEHEVTAFIRDLERADTALKPWKRIGHDAGTGEEFAYVDPAAPSGLQEHYGKLLSFGAARGLL